MLALIPVCLAYMILWIARRRNMSPLRKGIVALLGIVWLLFLPNTCYLLTEWRHYLEMIDRHDLYLRSQDNSVLFMHLTAWGMFYLLYSGFGMITFALAIRPVERVAAQRGASIWFWAAPLFVALSSGVYLGLVLRFNSWDTMSRPDQIWQAIVDIGGRPRLAAFIVGFGGFLWIAYEALDLWVDGLTERWSKLSRRQIHIGPRSSR